MRINNFLYLIKSYIAKTPPPPPPQVLTSLIDQKPIPYKYKTENGPYSFVYIFYFQSYWSKEY